MRSWMIPAAVLAALFGFSLWNADNVTGETERWRAQLLRADQLALSGDWDGARQALEESYQDWSGCQTYLHIVSQHGAVDDAESMYRRAAAFAATREITEFRAELADLRDQLRLLAEMEQCSLRNVLCVTGCLPEAYSALP